MDSEKFTNLPPNKLILQCAIPAIITSVFGALYAVIDGMFVGRYLGENALASINLIMPIIMIVEALSNMIATGASVNISMQLGAKKRKEASDIFSFSIKVIIAISCILGILGFAFARPFVEFIAPGAEAEAIAYSVDYLKVYAIFSPLIPVYFAIDNYLRVCGKHNFSMIVGVVSQLANVVLDFIFILVWKQGIVAAAIASCISIAGGSLVMLVAFTGKRLDVYYTRDSISWKHFFHIIANGASEFFSTISMSIMSIIMNVFLLRYGGTTAIAAFSIVMYVDSVIGMVNFGVCDSLQPAISYCYGAGKIERMKDIFRRVVIGIIVISVLAFLFMFFAGPYVATVFIRPGDVELKNVSDIAIKIFSLSYLVGWIDMCYSSYFTAIDKPVRSLMVSIFGTLIFPVMFLCLLTKLYGLTGVWLMTFVAGCASGVLTLILAKTMKIDSTKKFQGKGYV